MLRRAIFAVSAILVSVGLIQTSILNAFGGPSTPDVEGGNWTHEMFVGPKSKAVTEDWLNSLRDWREEKWKELAQSDRDWDRNYRNPDLSWVQKNFIQPQMMAHDRYFFDPSKRTYTVERYLTDLQDRYGGIDSVLIWPTYPNIGVDNRNQFDLIRDMPGGLDELHDVVNDFHRKGVRVLFPLNPWDNGTRNEGEAQPETIARLLATIDGDGFNGDTMTGVSREFFEAGQRYGKNFVIEPEVGVGEDFEALGWNLFSWGYWMDYQAIPGVDRYKWIAPLHMTHVCRREAHDRTDELQYAWFNGAGYESWENLWGTWNGITPRDASVIKRLSRVFHELWDFLISTEWQPHFPTLQEGVFASHFSHGGAALFTVINRSYDTKSGDQIDLPFEGAITDTAFFDLWHGVELIPGQVKGTRNGKIMARVSFEIEPWGFGAVLAVPRDEAGHYEELLLAMKELEKTPLSQLSAQWKPLPQQIVEGGSEFVPVASSPQAGSAEGMVRIPANDHFIFKVSGIEIEQYDGGDFQYTWENAPQLDHEHEMKIHEFLIDRNLVTNRQFKVFLDQSGYHPLDQHNFLRHWMNGEVPRGAEDLPVTWVSIEDARAYAKWAGKRLPHEWEWQYAAQGTDGRLYPWGKDWNPAFVPSLQTGREDVTPETIGRHPEGASPFGVVDLVGNVWQWTDEYRDEHTRAAVIRGGSLYQPQGSQWYFPQAYQLNQHGKYLLMAPSLDRSGAIGFRCVMDAT